MSSSQKALVVAVVVVLVLFAIAVVNQRRAGDGDVAERPDGLVGALGKLLGRPAAVERADLSAACLQADGRLVFRGSCTVRVAPSDERLRTLRLRAQAATTVVSPAPEGDVVVRTEVDAGGEVPFAVGRDGADVELTCGARTCVVEPLPER